ncbi:MAG: hypothetical protein KC609_02750 [Myxococcales bacterium]|nr:hypothetical protein [Myxococcales bacterium]
MRTSKQSALVAVLALAGLALASCQAAEPRDPNRVSLTLSLGLEELQQSLVFQQMTHFRLKILGEPTSNPNSKVIFDSNCLKYEGDNFEIQDIEAGDGRVVFFEGFEDSSCTKRVLVGARGGLSIKNPVPTEGFYYMHVAPVEQFSLMPTPNPTFVASINKTPCQTNAECEGFDGAAYCRAPGNTCHLETYYPLNLATRRAFHQAAELDNGMIVFTGGFTAPSAADKEQFLTTERIEVFNPLTMLFERKDGLSDSTPAGYALHGLVKFDGNKIANIGGFNQARWRLAGDRVDLLPSVPTAGCTNNKCLLDTVSIFDIGRSTYVGNSLPLPLGMPLAGLVKDASTPTILLGSGFTSSQTAPVSNQVYACDFTGTSQNCTRTAYTLGARRRGAALFCRTANGNGCDDYVVLGGNLLSDANVPLLEGIDVKNNTKYAITPAGDAPTTLTGATVVNVDGTFYVFGGVDEKKSGNPNVPPMKLTFNGATATFTKLTLTGVDEKKTYRVYHTATVLKDGRVLLIGGLDDQRRPTASALVFIGDKYSREVMLNVARFGHSVSTLRTGLIPNALLIVGGFNTDGGALGAIGAAELFVTQ